jgi:ATP-dependent DNA helicase PIF1
LDPSEYKVAAPTGKAANNVKGTTLHTLLNIKVEKGDAFTPLSSEAAAELAAKFKNVKLLLVDEFSMIGARMLYKMDARLKQAFNNNDKPFGGCHVVLIGDTRQLEPVMDTALWSPLRDRHSEMAQTALRLFQTSFTRVITLTENRRQDGTAQSTFRDLLLRLRTNSATLDDYNELEKRRDNLFTKEVLEKEFANALHLMPTREMVANHNSQAIQEIHTLTKHPLCVINAINSKGAEKKNPDFFSNLESSVVLVVGAQVMITSNLWVEVGLTNGAIGTITHIVYKDGEAAPVNQPRAVIVRMQDYEGPHLPGMPGHVAINALQVTADNLIRTNFPLRICAACTVHKSQGFYLFYL